MAERYVRDFDHGLNAAVRRLRETLGDSADSPGFIETIPRKGYRLVAATDVDTPAPPPSVPAASMPGVEPNRTTGQAGVHVKRMNYLTIAIGCVAIAAAGAWLTRTARPATNRPTFATFPVDVPAGWNIQFTDHIALSPDGRYIAFTAAGPDHRGALWLRALTEPAARQVSGSESAAAPFWSADGTRVGFFANGALRAVTLADGRVQTLTGAAPPVLQGGAAAWTTAGDILFMPLGSALGTPVHAATLRRLDFSTGTVQPFAPSTERRDYIDHLAPFAIPGTNGLTFIRWNPSTLEMTAHVGEVGTSRTTDLGRTDSRVVVTESGHAVFVRNGVLVAQPFDIKARTLVGAPFPVAQEVAVYQPMLGHFSASSDLIVYLTRSAMINGIQLMLVDRNGTPKRMIADGAEFSLPRVSPDGTLVAYQSSETGRPEVFVETFPEKGGRWQATTRGAMEPMWRGDGHELFFLSSDNELCAIDVERSNGAVRFGAPRVLFRLQDPPYTTRHYAPLPDGQRFITLAKPPRLALQRMTVLVNWRSALSQ